MRPLLSLGVIATAAVAAGDAIGVPVADIVNAGGLTIPPGVPALPPDDVRCNLTVPPAPPPLLECEGLKPERFLLTAKLLSPSFGQNWIGEFARRWYCSRAFGVGRKGAPAMSGAGNSCHKLPILCCALLLGEMHNAGVKAVFFALIINWWTASAEFEDDCTFTHLSGR